MWSFASRNWPVRPQGGHYVGLGAIGELATSRVEIPPGSILNPPSPTLPELDYVSLPTMSYGKKDEDADIGLIKVDRTQVFQEGELPQKWGPKCCQTSQGGARDSTGTD